MNYKQCIKRIVRNMPIIKNEISKRDIEIFELKNERSKLHYTIATAQSEQNNLQKELFNLHQARYKLIIKQLSDRIKNGRKIRVCFFVMNASAFSVGPLYYEMINDELFEPFIVIIPDLSRGDNHLCSNFDKTYSDLKEKYIHVFKGYDLNGRIALDYSDKVDLVNFQLPYEGMSHEYFEVSHYLNKNVLPFYISYTYDVTIYLREKASFNSYNLFWKIFVNNEQTLAEIANYGMLKGKNVYVSGYCKMDFLAKQDKVNCERKRIILAPHHTITDWEHLQISNFLKYADLFHVLPNMYPNVDFIFRPHPLLIVQLKKKEIWGEEKTEKYFRTMASYSNVTYSYDSDYFKLFINSDGIINDCSSFLAEYLFTEKPACYMLKNRESYSKWFLPIGQKCLDHCYLAYSEEDIVDFIDQVIINEKDFLKDERTEFVNSELKINFPHAAQVILKHIKEVLC